MKISSNVPLQPNQNVMLKQVPRSWAPATITSQAVSRSHNLMTAEGKYNTTQNKPTKLKFYIERKRKLPM